MEESKKIGRYPWDNYITVGRLKEVLNELKDETLLDLAGDIGVQIARCLLESESLGYCRRPVSKDRAISVLKGEKSNE